MQEITPNPQAVRIAGKLDQILFSDKSFILISNKESADIPCLATGIDPMELQIYLGKTILVSGKAFFDVSGKPERIEAHRISPATDDDLSIWAELPKPIPGNIHPGEFRKPQDSTNGINAIIGKWHGDESDGTVQSALDTLS